MMLTTAEGVAGANDVAGDDERKMLVESAANIIST
jgi:hypothetical protein